MYIKSIIKQKTKGVSLVNRENMRRGETDERHFMKSMNILLQADLLCFLLLLTAVVVLACLQGCLQAWVRWGRSAYCVGLTFQILAARTKKPLKNF